MSDYPRVTIVTPSYNQGKFLENTIVSVLEQQYENLEYIVMDGSSTDNSIEIIKKYSKYINYWRSHPDKGQVEAINSGFKKATGEILTFLNSDDFLLENAIITVINKYHEYPNAAGWVGGGYGIAQDGFIIQTRLPQNVERDNIANWFENWFYQPSCFFSAKAAKEVGYLNPNYQNSFDFDFWMRLSEQGRIIPFPEVISATTVHPGAKTQKYQTRMYKENKKIQLSYGYKSYADISQSFIDRSSTQNLTGIKARILYETQIRKRKDPNRYIRFPEIAKNK